MSNVEQATSVEQAVRTFVTETLGRDIAGFSATDSLLEAGIIDSLGVVALVEFVAERFGIVVDVDDMVPENFDSLQAIVTFVESKTRG